MPHPAGRSVSPAPLQARRSFAAALPVVLCPSQPFTRLRAIVLLYIREIRHRRQTSHNDRYHGAAEWLFRVEPGGSMAFFSNGQNRREAVIEQTQMLIGAPSNSTPSTSPLVSV